MSFHVGVHLSVLQQNRNMIKWKITMSVRHAIGARWQTTNIGDVLQCPNARLKHAADHVAFELPRSSLHGETASLFNVLSGRPPEGFKRETWCLRREHGRNMIERIVGGRTPQQIRTSDVALNFELLLLTVVCGIGEQAHGGSRAMKKHIIPSSCDSQVCITNLLDATKMLQMMCCAKKNVALAWNMCNRGHRGSEHQPYNMCRTRTGTEKHTVTVIFSYHHPH